MSIENELKDLIIKKGKSIRQFAYDLDMPATTIQSMLNNGIEKAGIKKVIKICDYLGIDPSALALGYIKEKTISSDGITKHELEHLDQYRYLDEYGKKQVNTTLALEFKRVQDLHNNHFTDYDQALDYVMQNPMFAMGGINLEELEQEELIHFANDQFELERKYLK